MYLIACYKDHEERCELSTSRNALKHCKEKNARQVQVYDRNGWLLSIANQGDDGRFYRPKLFLDGEPRKYYAELYQAMR